MALAGYFSYLGGVPQVLPLGAVAKMGHEPPSLWAGSARRPLAGREGLVAGLRVGQAFVMVWGRQLQPLGS